MGLLDDSDQSDNEVDKVDLKVNKKFAEKFEKQERFKELQRSKELLKNGIVDDSEDSESESEDEDAEQLSTALDLKIIQTINSIRKKDPRIYDQTTTWFEKPAEDSEEEEEEGDEKVSSRKKKYKDVLREQLLTHGADIEGENAKLSKKVHDSHSKNKLSYNQEQELVRQEFLKAAGGGDKKSSSKKQTTESSDDNDGSDDDEVLMTKHKTPQQVQQEEIELKAALKEMKELGSKDSKRVISKSTAVMSSSMDPSEDPEEFLNNYLTNQKWKEKSGSSSVSRKKRDVSSSDEDEDISDEEELDKVDRFESKYNFRFEELQAEGGGGVGSLQVTGHARDVAGSLRRVDDKRKQQREQRQERKEKEKRKQEAELRRLKNLKRQELKERLAKIGEIAGLKQIGLDESLLDEDWDPKKHEAMMNAQFNEDYYGEEDEGFHYRDQDGAAGGEEDVGGDYTTQELLAFDGYDDEEQQGEGEEYPEEGDYEMDEEEVAEVKHMVNELYQLDYEDIVAGIPCRFKYKEVQPEGFGLTAEEILQADDSELNKFVSLKHISAYNTKGYSKSEHDISKKRKKLRAAVKERQAKEALEAEILGKELKGTKKNKSAEAVKAEQTMKNDDEEEAEEEAVATAVEGGEGEGKKKRKRRKAKSKPEGSNGDAGRPERASSSAGSEKPAESKKAKTESVAASTTVSAASLSTGATAHSAVASNGVVKVGTNKERKLKVLESKKKHRQKLIEQSKEKAAVKKALKSATGAAPTAATAAAGGNSNGNGSANSGLKKRLDLYK